MLRLVHPAALNSGSLMYAVYIGEITYNTAFMFSLIKAVNMRRAAVVNRLLC